jgi:hypothetical protein
MEVLAEMASILPRDEEEREEALERLREYLALLRRWDRDRCIGAEADRSVESMSGDPA